MDTNKKIKVINRNGGPVGYTVPELGIRRQFMPKEEKSVTFEELEKLSYMRGGKKILEEYLVIKDSEALDELLPYVKSNQPEYFYTETDIERMLTTASLDEFLDCLDFAPSGIIDMIKTMSVDIELNDIRKRNAIFDKTGFDVSKAIEVKNTKYDGDIEVVEEDNVPKRRVAINNTEEKATGRRTTTPKFSYNPVE